MKKLQLAVDVDMTVVDVLQPWVQWMGINHPEDYIHPAYESLDGHYNHHLADLYGVDPDQINDFWKKNDLYDNLQPMDGSVEAYKKLKEHFDVYFLTICYAGHKDSKQSFLQRHFGEDIEMIDSMSCKSHYDFNMLIDDNPKVLMGVHNAPQNFEHKKWGRHLVQLNQITPQNMKLLSNGDVSSSIIQTQHWNDMDSIIARCFNVALCA